MPHSMWSIQQCTSAAQLYYTYRVIKKPLCTWWLQHRKLQVMFEVSSASPQTFIDTPNCVFEDRVQYSTVRIPNVFCDGHLQIINCVGIVRICWVFYTVIIRSTETFGSPCITFNTKHLLQHVLNFILITVLIMRVNNMPNSWHISWTNLEAPWW
jgi:hypothetical protein